MFLTAIITASDKGYAGERTDESGPAIAAMLDENYWVVSRTVLPDDRKMLADEMRRLCRQSMDIIFTTGGHRIFRAGCDPGGDDGCNRPSGARYQSGDDVSQSERDAEGHAEPWHCRHLLSYTDY